jgi:uncharacterized membrane protein YdjX (TVP38/TMEM64 family)
VRGWRIVLGTLVFAAIGGAWVLGFADPARLQDVEAWLATLGSSAPVVFLAVKVATVVLALPSAPVALLGGVLFGPVLGTALNGIGAVTGSTVTFFVGRWLGRETVEARLGGRLAELDARLAENGLPVMLFLRLVPLFPFNAINYGSGLTRISFRDYLVGTGIGILPGAIVFTWLGHSAAGGSAFGVTVGLSALGLLSLLPLWFRRVRRGSIAAGVTKPDEPG